jgi:hypothetical protein
MAESKNKTEVIIDETGQNAAAIILSNMKHRPDMLAKNLVQTVPGAGAAFTGYSAGQGIAAAKDLYGHNNPGLAEYLASAAGSVGQGLTFGVMSAEDIANKIVPISVVDRAELLKK